MRSKTLQGKAGEGLACHYLEQQGLTLVERNFRCRRGELDLIMRDGDQLVFVEVRSRRKSGYGTPAETITKTKQNRLVRTALYYLQRRRWCSVSCRFDVIAITLGQNEDAVEWIKNAFQAN